MNILFRNFGNVAISLVLSLFSLNTFAGEGCSPQKIGHIMNFPSNVPDLLTNLSQWFPVDLNANMPGIYDYRVLQNIRTIDGIDAVVDEMEAIVNDMKSKGIHKIIVQTFSSEAGPFIEGGTYDANGVCTPVGNLNCVHSDIRHPDVTFAANRQGTTSVDNAQNWYRASADFRSGLRGSAILLLPDVNGIVPKPQYIAATDNSAAIASPAGVYKARAIAAGYDYVEVDLDWNAGTLEFENISGLSNAILNAPPQSKVGISMTAERLNNVIIRYVDFYNKGIADPNIFNPTNANVTYLSVAWRPYDGDLNNPGLAMIPVDLFFGIGSLNELVYDPDGLNKYLVRLGFPDDITGAGNLCGSEYGGDCGLVSTFAWFATCERRNLDNRFKIDENRQRVYYYAAEEFLPANTPINDIEVSDLIVNPAWLATP